MGQQHLYLDEVGEWDKVDRARSLCVQACQDLFWVCRLIDSGKIKLIHSLQLPAKYGCRARFGPQRRQELSRREGGREKGEGEGEAALADVEMR